MIANLELYGHVLAWQANGYANMDRARYEESRGCLGEVYRNKAQVDFNVASALLIEAVTGEPHCSCCFRPRGGFRPFWRKR